MRCKNLMNKVQLSEMTMEFKKLSKEQQDNLTAILSDLESDYPKLKKLFADILKGKESLGELDTKLKTSDIAKVADIIL